MKKEIIEKYQKDKIINLCIEMINNINKVKRNDYNITENDYQFLISNLASIIESRIIYLNFWEEK